MEQHTISIILCTYNRATMLPRMIKSILNQDFLDFELLIINNGSIDNTEEVCIKYKNQDKRIKLFTLPQNIGPNGGKNFGLDHAKTDYICFVDDDDFCEKNYLSLLYSSIIKYKADICVTGCVDEYSDKIVPRFDYKDIYIWNKVRGVSELLKREKFNAAPPTKIFKKSLFNNIRFIDCKGPDDIHIIYKLFVEAEKIVVRGEPTYHFYKHLNNITSFITENKITGEILDEYLRMQTDRIKYISDKLPELASQVRYSAYSYMISMVDKIKTGHGENCENQLDKMLEHLRNNKYEFLSSEWVTNREINLMSKYVTNITNII